MNFRQDAIEILFHIETCICLVLVHIACNLSCAKYVNPLIVKCLTNGTFVGVSRGNPNFTFKHHFKPSITIHIS